MCAWLLVARLDSLLLFPIAFAILALSRVALVARGAILPEAIPPGRTLVAANSSLAKTSAAAGIVVVPVGLGLLRVFGTGAELRFAGLVYLAGAVALPRSRRAARAEAGPGPVRPIPARLRRAVVATAGLRFGVGFLAFHLAFGLRREHVGAIGLGVLIAAAALGALCGGAIAGRLRAVLAEDGIVAASLVLAALAAGAAGVWLGIAAAACLTGAFGLASGASKIAFDALLQSVTPEGARGRAFARYEAVWQLSWVAGALVPVAIALPLQAGVVAAGVLAAALGVLYALGSLRSARRPPRGATEIPPPRS